MASHSSLILVNKLAAKELHFGNPFLRTLCYPIHGRAIAMRTVSCAILVGAWPMARYRRRHKIVFIAADIDDISIDLQFFRNNCNSYLKCMLLQLQQQHQQH